MESSDPLSRNDISFRDDEWDRSVLGLKTLSRVNGAEKEKKERKRKSAVERVRPAFHVEEPVVPIYQGEDVQMRGVSYDDLAAVEQGWNDVEEPPYQEHYAEASSHEDVRQEDQQYPAEEDYVVPMDFGSSGSHRISSPAAFTSPQAVMTGTSNGSPDLQLFVSPAKRKGTPSPVKALSPSKRYTRPPSPWLRPAISQEESIAQQEATEDYWAPLQDNVSDSDEEQQVVEDVEQSVPKLRSEGDQEQEQEDVDVPSQIDTPPVLESIFPRRSVSKEPTLHHTGRSISRETSVQPTIAPRAPSVQPISSRAASIQPTTSRAPSFQPTRIVSREPEIARTQNASLPLAVPVVVIAPATPSPIKLANRLTPHSKPIDEPSQAPSPVREFSPAPSQTREHTKSPSIRSRTQTASPVPFTRRYASPVQSSQSSAPIPPTQYSVSTQHRGQAEMPDAPPEQEQSGLEQDESDDEESGGFGGGRTLSQRFASLEAKLAKEGRSFRFSEIAAIPSSDHSIHFGPSDLPDSSPQKASTIEEEEEEVLQESFILDEEDELMDVAPEPQSIMDIPRREKISVVQEALERAASEQGKEISPIRPAPSVHEECLQVAQESYVEQVTDVSMQGSEAPTTVVVPSLGSAFPSPLMARQEMLVDEDVQAEELTEEVIENGPFWEDEMDAEPLVQIRSMDPQAAARAAAILNMVRCAFHSSESTLTMILASQICARNAKTPCLVGCMDQCFFPSLFCHTCH